MQYNGMFINIILGLVDTFSAKCLLWKQTRYLLWNGLVNKWSHTHFVNIFTAIAGKLLSRSYKIAYALLTKSFSKNGDTSLKSGDRVALVYPNNDPINFLCAYYGCIQAGIVPVPIEVPITRRDAGSLQIGFLLGSCAVQVTICLFSPYPGI